MVAEAKAVENIVDRNATNKLYSKIQTETSFHKALDFSNIGMPIETVGGAKTDSEKHLRQFHQTRIFIQNFGAMRHHAGAMKAGTYLISANLPEQISYGLKSKWDTPLAAFGSTKVNALVQFGSAALRDLMGTDTAKSMGLSAISGVSGVHRATSFMIWGGTDPLVMQLSIPVIDDTYNTTAGSGISSNFTEALEFLSCLCLPSETNAIGFYKPPPSPLEASLKLTSNFTLNFRNPTPGRIMVQLGGILLVDNCIIKEINVTYPKTKALIKHEYASKLVGTGGNDYLAPLLAKIDITISTIEALTSNAYTRMLWLKEQPDQGKIRGDVSAVGDLVMGAITG